MKLIKTKKQEPVIGFPKACREWWDLGAGYEVYVSLGEKWCSFGIDAPNKKDITREVADYLGIDTDVKHITFEAKGRELYLSPSIDCVMLNYAHPERYKDLLSKIEQIVNMHFKKNI